MINKITAQTIIDPSEIRQEFSDVNTKLLCCRYWVLDEWKCSDLSVPFWRIYHNSIPGAKILFSNKETALKDDILVIIPPNTSFSTELYKDGYQNNSEGISGRKFEKTDSLSSISKKHMIDHLFIHFSLGFPLDFAQTGIYVLRYDAYTLRLVSAIQEACMDDTYFSFSECLKIKQLISFCLLHLEDDIWKFNTIDQRIFAAMKFIEKNYSKGISNEELANRANMAVNSFARLFKDNTGQSIQQYIIKIKIETACNMMHHSNKTIDEIAYECGFSDRHHFSKIFKKIIQMNPAYYKKHLTMV